MIAFLLRVIQKRISKRKAKPISILLCLLFVLLLWTQQTEARKRSKRSKRTKSPENTKSEELAQSSSSSDRNPSEEPPKKAEEAPEDSIGTKNKNAKSSNILEGNTGYISITGTDRQEIQVE